ncbi:hypothetical protein SKAU_G00310660 [Synaphobranchus kaupii]|uniref:AXH domain-containing protein n=1 Tax=Synaphobranchus kaupii TaxID=118154 RepID=A0A9Q1IL77_SYNKA|nr:hypothetical protein SKAU_G00310660 [Synaphobranchus kaupii]
MSATRSACHPRSGICQSAVPAVVRGEEGLRVEQMKGPPAHGSSSACSESQGGGTTLGEWMRVQPGLQYSVENADGISVPVDQYSMLYKVALPSVTYSPTNLHPVLSHISPAYTVPSSALLQHPGISYSPLGYAQIPHSSLQFVSSPYALPYAVPPGFVPSPLISPQSAIPQPPHVSHLVPYPSVIQEGVASPPSQPLTSAHAFAKVAPLVLPPEQHLGPVGGMAAGEVSPRGVAAFYHHPGSRAAQVAPAVAYRDARGAQELNGGEEERGARELLQDSVYSARAAWPAASSTTADSLQDRVLGARRYEDRGSPGRRSTPDTDLEVQQVVGRLTSPNQGVTGSYKEEPLGPLNLSQSAQRSWQALPAACVENMVGLARPVYEAHPTGASDPRVAIHQQLGQPARHAVMLANGQPVLVPLDYKQQHYANLTSDMVTTTAVTPVKHSRASDSPAQVRLPDRAPVELPPQQLQVQPGPAVPVPVPVQTQAPPSVTQNPSHFMKGAIIQLATGELKRVEDLQTQDFVKSAEVSGGLKIDSSMVVDIRKSQQKPGLMALHFTVGEQQSKVTIDVPPEHPFFVFGQGWSSCSPDCTAQLYGLACHHLQVGDVCVSITLQQPQRQEKPLLQQQQQSSRTPTKVSSATSVIAQSMGPPGPQHQRPQAQFRAESSHRERERGEEEEPMQVRGGGHGDTLSRPDRTSAEHIRSLSSNYLHTEGTPRTVAAMRGLSSSIIGAQRHWSVPSFQRYGTKEEEEAHPSSSGSSRPSFIPQEVKLSIEGRSNAGK